MNRQVKSSLKFFLIELLVYAVLVTGYFLLVLNFIGPWLHQLFQNERRAYAAVALGLIMVVGTIGGVEGGAQVIQWLKHTTHMDSAVGLTFVVVLLGISGFMAWESVKTM